MRYASLIRLPLLLAALFVASACDNGEVPTTPTPPTVTETYTGTIPRNGSQLHTFIAGAAGTVTATVSAVTPAGSPAIGFSLGTWDGIVCTAVMTNNAATTASALSGTVVGITSLCIRLFDPFGSIAEDAPVAYTVTVVRP